MNKIAYISFFFLSILFTISIGLSEARFEEKKDGIIVDVETGLMWSKTFMHSNKVGYHKIIESVNNFKRGGYDDWRLPTLEELKTISLTRCGRIVGFDYPKHSECGKWPRATSQSYRTSNEVEDFLMYEYMPYADAFAIENKYSTMENGYWKIIRMVRGTMNNPEAYTYLPKGHEYNTFEESEKVLNIVKPDGFAYYKTYGHKNSYVTVAHLIPKDVNKWKLLTRCPETAFTFVRHFNPSKIRELSIEDTIMNNDYKRMNFVEIKGFAEYYKKFLKFNKFEMAKKKYEVYDKLIECWQDYSTEFNKYLNSTFLLTPFQFYKVLKQDDYNVDNEDFTLKRDKMVVDYSDSFYGAEVSPFQYLKNIPVFGDFKLKFPLDDAAKMFEDHKKIGYRSRLYVKPINKVWNYVHDHAHAFDVQAVCFDFIDIQNNKMIMQVLLHDIKPIYDEDGKRIEEYTWTTEIIK